MKLETITVRNFRSIREQTLELDGLTALVGANGAGKSAFIKAIDLFQSEKPQVDEEDYHASTTRRGRAPVTGNDISIKLQFGELSDPDREAFADYVPDGHLVVERVFKWDPEQVRASDITYGHMPQNPDFDQIRDKSAQEAKDHYNSIREKYGFPPWTSHAKAKLVVAAWEKEHHAELQKHRDDGKSFKITGKGEKTLDTHVRFIIVPAVRDASDDAAGKKDSAVLHLTEELTSSIYDDPDFAKFREGAMKKYADMMGGFEAGQLKKMAESVTKRVGELAEGVSVDLAWSDTHLQIDVPDTHARLAEDDMAFEAKRVGHGSQRAFIIAMLQEIAANAAAASSSEPGRSRTVPAFILVIEEPELYQHPIRQRHMARVFADLARHEGGRRIQILYTSHSPHFVGMDRLENIRLIKKRQTDAKGPATTVHRTRLADVKKRLYGGGNGGTGAPTSASLADRLRVTMTPWLNEGFFANLVVLVEGDNDYAAIQGAARSLGINFEKIGVSIIPCNGKNNMGKPLAVFSSLGIKTYIVWDADRGHKNRKAHKCASRAAKSDNAKRTNKKLLELLGLPPKDWPSGVHEKYTCFEDNLNASMRSEITEPLYSGLREEAMKRFDIADEAGAEKKSLVMVEILTKARDKGHPCDILDKLVRIVERLAGDERDAWRGGKKRGANVDAV